MSQFCMSTEMDGSVDMCLVVVLYENVDSQDGGELLSDGIECAQYGGSIPCCGSVCDTHVSNSGARYGIMVQY